MTTTNKQEFLAAADKHGVGHAGMSLWRWIERGTDPGGFLAAVLCNDLTKAVSKADDRNVELIPSFVKLLYNHAPSGCWGSDKRVEYWRDAMMLNKEKHNLVRIPRAFLDDHAQRDLDTPKVWRSTARHYWVHRKDPAIPELLSDAELYADGVGWFDDCYFGLISSARATVNALTQENAA